MTPEQIVKNAILTYLNLIPGCVVLPISTTGMFDVTKRIYRKSTQRLGTPDILCCYLGRFVAIEVKSKRGKVSDNQKELLEEIRSKGQGIAFVARSVQDVIDQFTELKKIIRPTSTKETA